MIAYRKRQPYINLANSYLIDSPQPSSLNYWYNLGSLLGLCLVIQIASGIFLAMHYSSHIELAFDSVEHIMRDVNLGWLIRYIHANGASFFFGCMYIHIGKALYYGSYRKPRVLVWIIGVIILIATMATGFMGSKNSSSPKSLNAYKLNNNKMFNKRQFSTFIFNKKEIKISTLLKNKDNSNSQEILKDIGINPEIWWDNLEKGEIRENIRENLKDKSGIYIIINKISKNYYIGSGHTNNLYSRFYNHLLTNNKKGSKLVQRAVKKYGINNFIYGILEYYPFIVNIRNNEELFALETSYISLLLPAYNIMPEAGQFFGYKTKEININNKSNLINLTLLEDRKILLQNIKQKHLDEWKLSKKIRTDFNLSKEGLYNITKGSSKIIYISNSIITEDDIINNNYLCSFKNINTAAHFLCCSSKTIQRSLHIGNVFIPDLFIPYLNNSHINSYNSIIEYIDTSKLDIYKYKKNKHIKLRASLVNYNNFTKFYISSKLSRLI